MTMLVPLSIHRFEKLTPAPTENVRSIASKLKVPMSWMSQVSPDLHGIGWTVPIWGAVTDTQKDPARGAIAVALATEKTAKTTAATIPRIVAAWTTSIDLAL